MGVDRRNDVDEARARGGPGKRESLVRHTLGGGTTSHPFWSQDRQAFVSAELLRTTERLRLEDGRTAAVIRIEQLPGTQSVYNLEVDGEHVYHVGLHGVLVHNMCTPVKPVLLGRFMDTRVKPVARAKGYDWYKSKPRGPSKGDLDQWEVNNLRWLKEQITSGRPINDIGVPKGVDPGRFVRAERGLLREMGYQMVRRGRIKVDGEWFQLFEWVK